MIAATLQALTEEAAAGLGGQATLRISHFPFKVGRECRLPGTERPWPRAIAGFVERRLRRTPQLNDLYVIEWPSAEGFHLSREHFAIERVGSRFVVVDRGSASGTRVGETRLSVDSTAQQAEVHDGDVIVAGSQHSPYRYRFDLSAG